MEILNACHFRLGYYQITAVFSAEDQKELGNAIQQLGKQVKHLSFSKQAERYKVETMLRISKREKPFDLLTRLSSFPSVQLESVE